MKKPLYIIVFISLMVSGIISCNKKQDTTCPNYAAWIPNSFSPNADGVNDVFVPKFANQSVVAYEMQIFDKNGDKLYDSTDPNIGWDGSVNNTGNTICPAGTYVYLIHVTDACGNKHTYNGNLTLLK